MGEGALVKSRVEHEMYIAREGNSFYTLSRYFSMGKERTQASTDLSPLKIIELKCSSLTCTWIAAIVQGKFAV